VTSPAARLAAGAGAGDCFAGAPFVGGAAGPLPILDAAALGEGRIAVAADGVRAGGSTWLYDELLELDPAEPFGVRVAGYGVAVQDPATGRFAPAGAPLWAGDRPSYGSSAIVVGDEVYAYGCRAAGDFRVACYVARAPAADIDEASAYAYFAGGGNWSSDVDAAVPITAAGSGVTVRYYEDIHRYLLLDSPVLGRAVEVRSGLGPEGPWSEPYEVAACDLPADDPGAVCAGAAAHPELTGGRARGGVAVSYGIVSLSEDGAARALAEPARYWPRLAELPLPEGLP
jgi:hypothetical protein